MAGFKVLGPSFFNRSDSNLAAQDRAVVAGDRALLDASFDILSGPASKAGPIQQPTAKASGGHIVASFLGDFYERIHFTPGTFDFSNFTADTVRTVRVMNGFLSPTDITSLVVPEGFGVSLVNELTFPESLEPLQEIAISLDATALGAATFAFDTALALSQGPSYGITTTGERSVVSEWGPNWRESMRETLAFKTEVVNVSRDGGEQRRALRNEPRQTFGYTMSLFGQTRRLFEGFMSSHRQGPIGPAFGNYRPVLSILDPYRVRTTEVTPALRPELVVGMGNVPRWVLPGHTVHFRHKDVQLKRTATVGAVTEDSIVLQSGVPLLLPARTEVILSLACRVDGGTTSKRITSDIQESRIALSVLPGMNPEYTPGGEGLTYLGLEVLDRKPDWRGGLTTQWFAPIDDVDYGRGVIQFAEFHKFSAAVHKLSYVSLTAEKVLDLKDFFLRHKGQLSEFFIPSWTDDILPKTDLTLSSYTIRVGRMEFAEDFRFSSIHKHLAVYLNDGRVLYRAVAEISVVSDLLGDDSEIRLTEPWEEDFAVSGIRTISWVFRARMVTDTLTIDWVTDSKATSQLTVKVLEN